MGLCPALTFCRGTLRVADLRRILIVEDSPTQAELLRGSLVDVGFMAATAPDGETAITFLESGEFDLVITDVMMPGIDGYELCRRIKSHPTWGQLPVILLTSLTDPLDIVSGIECGADNFLTKPYNADDLIGRVRYLFANRDRRVLGKLRVGVEVCFLNRTFTVTSEKEQILDLLISTCEDIVRANRNLRASQEELAKAKTQVELYARRMELQARSSEDKYRRLMEQANDAIILMDTAGRILEVNRRGEQLLGRSAIQLVGRSFQEFASPEDRAADLAQFQRMLVEGHARRNAATLRRADGQPVCVDYSASLVELDGESAVVAIIHDVTERTRLETQLRQAQKMDAVGKLAGGVAHDFNNLLTIINGYSDLVLASLPAGDGIREMVGQMKEAGERAAALTRQLLTFSRQQVVTPQVLDLNAIVTDVSKLLRRLIGEDIELVTILSPSLGRVRADRGQIEQVLLNLAVNARDAMPEGGKLTVETSNAEVDANNAPGPCIMLAVSDTGCGMDEATRSRVFEPFFTTKVTGKGTGLGLATVYGIVQQANGSIHVSSEPGTGSSFRVYLPRVQDEAEQRESEAVPGGWFGTETVLLVEDEAGVRSLARAVLLKHGYRVLEAEDAQSALALAERHTEPIHLLLTDVVMPGMSGRELADRLVKLRPETKVLFMSGYTDDNFVRRGIPTAESAFLQKPFTMQTLTRTIREVLSRANPNAVRSAVNPESASSR